jgi:predicted GNAT family acetyltransferase
MLIRNAREEDIPVIVGFQKKMALETEQRTLDENELLKGVEAVFTDPAKGFYMVVERGGEIVATLMITPEWSDWRNRNFLWIQSLYVSLPHRRKGIFAELFKAVQQKVLGSDSFAGIRLYVDQENLPAQEAYRRVGMKSSQYHFFEWLK